MHIVLGSMRGIASCIVYLTLVHASAQDPAPPHAIGISLGSSFYPRAQVVDRGGLNHAKVPFTTGFGVAMSYRRWLGPRWAITGIVRADHLSYYFLWNGCMQPLGHWAVGNKPSVGLPPEEANFLALRVDLGRTILSKAHWCLRTEVGMELGIMPTSYHGFVQRGIVNGQESETARIWSVINEDERLFGRARFALSSAYADKRWNEWTLTLAAQLALNKDQVRGGYVLECPDGSESGTFNATLNAFELVVGRYFSWGPPKLPRWAL